MKSCECGCGNPAPLSRITNSRLGLRKGQPSRFIKGHARRGTTHSLERRLEMSRRRSGGKEPVVSPFVSGLLVQFDGNRWVALNPNTGSKVGHARIVWEQTHGPVPEGFHVHHKNGEPALLENDRLENLMLLTKEWNSYFMVNLAKGFRVPESRVTEVYLLVEHMPYENRFREVCRILAETSHD
jgi:hypothetical protein